MIAESGVRSSCETLARNSDFSLLARASSWLAAWSSEVRCETFSFLQRLVGAAESVGHLVEGMCQRP